jgi:hypothetical protein
MANNVRAAMTSRTSRPNCHRYVETELTQIRRWLAALPEEFEERLGPQLEAHGDFILLKFA